jgi:hypothetical protein
MSCSDESSYQVIIDAVAENFPMLQIDVES